MPIYTNEAGEEIEVDKTIEEIQASSKEVSEANATLIEEKGELETKLAGFSDKDYNFKAVLAKKEKGEEALTQSEEMVLSLKGQIDTLNNNINSGQMSRGLRRLVGSDEELGKKVKENFDKINVETTTEEEYQNKMDQAYKMTTGSNPNLNPLNVSNGTNGSAPNPVSKPGKLSEEAKSVGKSLGLTDEELEKA